MSKLAIVFYSGFAICLVSFFWSIKEPQGELLPLPIYSGSPEHPSATFTYLHVYALKTAGIVLLLFGVPSIFSVRTQSEVRLSVVQWIPIDMVYLYFRIGHSENQSVEKDGTPPISITNTSIGLDIKSVSSSLICEPAIFRNEVQILGIYKDSLFTDSNFHETIIHHITHHGYLAA